MSRVFLQRRAHKAGAQTCLARLIAYPKLRDELPVVICSEKGWLTRECLRHGVTCLVEPFPSVRSLAGRLFVNAAFNSRLARRLRFLNIEVEEVIANDYLEGPLALRLARKFQVPSTVLLRAGGMSAKDFEKYECGSFGRVLAVGDDLQAKARKWTSKSVTRIHDGLADSEFDEPRIAPGTFPRKVLVIGSPLAAKGWSDVIDAFATLAARGGDAVQELHFTGHVPDAAHNDLGLERVRGLECHFLGRVEGFVDLVRDYDLVINPSRAESFGMAALEVLAAGVPLLSSRVGVIEQVVQSDDWLFAPGNSDELALKLERLVRDWPGIALNVAVAQSRIRERFSIAGTVKTLVGE